MDSPDKVTGNNGDRAQQGKPPPSSASSGASSHGCRWRIGVAKQMNREGYHPVLMVNEYCGTGRLYHEHRLASQALATTGAILRRPCPCRASAADARSENPSRCGGDLVFPWSNTKFIEARDVY